MPIANIQILEGRTEAQKAELIEKVTQAISEVTGTPEERVRVLIQDVPKINWGIGGKSAKAMGR
ncbi:2-hydroxymuconate tautomerase [Alkalilimnicola sp. S0819]|uniref:2-hydroxymuconate tautomerase n=1 Tax=Alkalilimnicola sp. S0819 TaxID=2613922 RepID=UPI001261FFC5|nr:2-hydroxymuconate tautomerase [Alkalilimnicola sp. S0819]KAB7623348.1 4-oxalocrotonate tautomerase family protein [Alkalilimnicola sp. S0819]MPQ16887.1 4-oxalocrotonate tautomerase [Alkalilimnicola sp. S0819]